VRERAIARKFRSAIVRSMAFRRTHRHNRSQMPRQQAPEMQIRDRAAVALNRRSHFVSEPAIRHPIEQGGAPLPARSL